ncbi:hypothetical protein KAK07_20320 [Ideonella sp. 4Y16]|uniref:Uncharacterized protein n=1 Tax=Ideonella alba TaxID=2824118 RepID=A0A940YF09_9BURK|nr:hypothetical protein [Ideonella alba]MBQ0932021.1 hypothetical protein [Ideonella alba]MBQ0945696.1 hypothetical protein [Ideonella alba]
MPLQLARRFAAALRPAPAVSTCWADTQPMGLSVESPPRPRPFRQVLAGLQVQESRDEDLFATYFGAHESLGLSQEN